MSGRPSSDERGFDVQPRAVDPAGTPDAARSLDTLATLLIVVIAVSILFLAREILVPIAIAVIMSFVLSPPVKTLRAIGVGKRLSVVIVVLATFLVTVGIGAILAKQISDLAADAPKYQSTVQTKIDGLRDFAAHNPLLGKLNGVIADVSRMSPPTPDKPVSALPRETGAAPADRRPMPVEIVAPAPGALTILQTVAASAASPLATAAFIAIFIVFILLQREDLRNRFIRLFGFGDIQRTTAAMNDAARRLSRYFLAQVLLNTAFGLVVAVALMVIGVPGAILWGIVAIFMRFIPYIGSTGAALFPVVMAAATGQGWTMTIEVALLFGVTEVVTGQVIEPLVYGRNTGISPIAVVAAATFWTWLWGPIGLVLSTPLTVCLVVMGRHVERLSFLNVLLGDAPALTPVEIFYQCMLAGNAAEIADHADDQMRERGLVDYCDRVAFPALLMAQIDARNGALDEKRQMRIRDTMKGLIADLESEAPIDPPAEAVSGTESSADEAPATLEGPAESPPPSPIAPPARIGAEWARDGAVLCVAGRTPLDEAAAAILAELLDRHGVGVRVETADSLASRSVSSDGVRLVVLSFLDADLRIAQARFAVRRLRRMVPGRPIISAFWIGQEDNERAKGLCADVRSDGCVSHLPDAIKLCLEHAVESSGQD